MQEHREPAAAEAVEVEPDVEPEAPPNAPPPGPDPPGNGASTSPPGSILDQLAAQLQDAAAKATESQQASKALQDDVAALQRAYDDVGKDVDAYAKARPALATQIDDSTHYADRKGPVIITDVGAAKAAADAAWQQVRDLLAQVEQQKHDRWGDVLAAQDALAASSRARDDAASVFDDLKDRQGELTDQLKRLADLKTGIEAADAADDSVGMYVRFLEYQRELKGATTALEEVDAYRTDLEAAWSQLEHAKADVRQKAADSVHAQNQFDQAKAELERLAPNRVAETLKRVAAAGAGNGAAPAAPAAAPAA